MGLSSYQHKRTASPIELFSIRYYPVGASGGPSFGVGDGKGGVGPRTTHINSQKVDCCISGGNYVSSHSRDCSSMIH